MSRDGSDAVTRGDLRGPGAGPVTGDAAPCVELVDVVKEFRRARLGPTQRRGVVRALDHVSLTVRRGESFGIVGESGSGKSTLIRLVLGLSQPTSGVVRVAGEQVSGRSMRDLSFLRREAQLVFQDPYTSLDPRMRVRDVIAEPLVGLRIGTPAERTARIAELLAAVGLPPDAADRYPHQFSGGQRQRIAIARALAPRPALLLADEPVSALDVSVRAQVLNLLAELTAGPDLTLVLVSHDLGVVRYLCDRVAVLRSGRVLEEGPVAQVWDAPANDYTAGLLAASRWEPTGRPPQP